jgi:hypothetical protein
MTGSLGIDKGRLPQIEKRGSDRATGDSRRTVRGQRQPETERSPRIDALILPLS